MPVALLVAVALLSSALMASDLEHRSSSVIDPLTGMLNRNALQTRMAELTQQAAILREPVALIVGDLDNFKADQRRPRPRRRRRRPRTSPTGCASRCAPTTSPTAWAARSSSSCCPAPTAARRPRSPSTLRARDRRRTRSPACSSRSPSASAPRRPGVRVRRGLRRGRPRAVPLQAGGAQPRARERGRRARDRGGEGHRHLASAGRVGGPPTRRCRAWPSPTRSARRPPSSSSSSSPTSSRRQPCSVRTSGSSSPSAHGGDDLLQVGARGEQLVGELGLLGARARTSASASTISGGVVGVGSAAACCPRRGSAAARGRARPRRGSPCRGGARRPRAARGSGAGGRRPSGGAWRSRSARRRCSTRLDRAVLGARRRPRATARARARRRAGRVERVDARQPAEDRRRGRARRSTSSRTRHSSRAQSSRPSRVQAVLQRVREPGAGAGRPRARSRPARRSAGARPSA